MKTVEANGKTFEFDDAVTNDQISASIDEYFSQIKNNTDVIAGNVDQTTGAPFGVRTAVGAAKSPGDKLNTIKKYYPDARQYGEDNFVFTDPETGQQTLFNPPGMDVGDIGENLRVGYEVVGGAIGGGAAALVAPATAGASAVAIPAAAAAGAGVGGALFDWMSQGILGAEDTRSATKIIGDAGIETGVNFIGGKLGEAAGKMLGKFKNVVANKIKKPVTEVTGAASRMGVELPAGTVTGSKTLQLAEEALSKAPFAADVIGDKYSKSLSGMANFAKSASEKLSAETGETRVGMSILSGAKKQVESFKSESSRLYDNLWSTMPKDSKVEIGAFTSKLKEIATQFSDDPQFEKILTSPAIKSLLSAAKRSEKAGGVSVSTLKALRTKIGNELSDKSSLTDVAHGELKQLYGALASDMEKAAESFGPGASKALEYANSYYRAGAEMIENLYDPIIKKETPEMIARSIFGQEGAALKQYPYTQMKTLLDKMPKDVRNNVRAEIVRRLGLAKAGAQNESGDIFSPATFMTNYNRMDSKTKNLIFNTPELRSAIGDLAKVSSAIKDRAKMANNSGTAGSTLMLQVLTGGLAVSGNLGLAGAVLTPYASAKLMTSPAFVRWLTKSASIKTQSQMGAHIGRLIAIGEANPDIQDELYQFSAAFRDISPNNSDEGKK